MKTTKTKTPATIHTVRIEGKLGEQEIFAAAAAAQSAGCSHYAIEQTHPSGTGTWIASRGRAKAPLASGVSDAGCDIERSERS